MAWDPLRAQAGPAADAIYYHGNILTGVDLEAAHPQRVSAIAVAHGEILATGDDAAIIAKYKGAATQMVDLGGAFVMPGFNDAHTHLGDAGHIRLSVDLIGVKSLAEMQERIRAAAEKAAPGQWLSGGGWDHTLWASGKLPDRADIDAAAEGHPAIFVRVDGHIAVADSAALKAAGITRETKDPQGGKIDRDAQGEADGNFAGDGAGAGACASAVAGAAQEGPGAGDRGCDLARGDHGAGSFGLG